MKLCSKCGQNFPATLEYFGKDKYQNSGLTGQCKVCRRANTQKWRDENPEKVKKYNKEYYDDHREQELVRNKEWHRKNPEKWKFRRAQWYITNIEYARQWRRNYIRTHKAEIRDYDQKRYIRDRERIRTYSKWWRQKFPEKRVLIEQRRIARELALPNTLTETEWLYAIEYWKQKCVYCNRGFDHTSHKLTLDHYIPLAHAKCPGTTANNSLPACLSCNTSKGAKEAIEWLLWRFSKEIANIKQNEIRAYFNSLNSI